MLEAIEGRTAAAPARPELTTHGASSAWLFSRLISRAPALQVLPAVALDHGPEIEAASCRAETAQHAFSAGMAQLAELIICMVSAMDHLLTGRAPAPL